MRQTGLSAAAVAVAAAAILANGARTTPRAQARDGSDVEGWLRLVRAYVVLDQRDEAQSAAAAARRALAADPEKVRRIDALVKDLGLEG